MNEKTMIKEAFRKMRDEITQQYTKIDNLAAEIQLLKNQLGQSTTSSQGKELHKKNNYSYVENYFTDVQDILKTIDKEQIHKAIMIFYEAWNNDQQIFFLGNGGSASTATHLAADFSKTAIVKGKKRFKGISLFDNVPLVSAWINDEGWENVYLGQLENFFQPGDVIVGVSVHGGGGRGNAGAWSQNIVKAMKYAKDHGGKCVGFSGFDGGIFSDICDANIIVTKDSTPQVEGFHVVLQHLIVFRLKEIITGHPGE